MITVAKQLIVAILVGLAALGCAVGTANGRFRMGSGQSMAYEAGGTALAAERAR